VTSLSSFRSSARFRTPLSLGALRNAAVTAGIGYACTTVGYALVRPLLGERQGWIELTDDLEPWAYAPAPVVGLLGAALGSSGLTAAGAAAAATFALRWGHRFLRKTRRNEAPGTASDLTVMSFNTLAWQREGRDLEASIARADPDIVGLQEIGPNGAWHLVKAFADRYPYHFVTESANPSGMAVLSRYPIGDPVAFKASARGHWWQRMTVDTPSGSIAYFNIHTRIPYIQKTHKRLFGYHIPLQFHPERRRNEVRVLAEMLDAIDGPAIVTGDFNMTERSADHRLMSRRLNDAYRSVGSGFGLSFPRRGALPRPFPSPIPMLRLDYVWHSDHFQPAWAYIGDAGHSDHHPVVAGLRWAEPAAVLRSGIPLAASAV
jgi:endonuclease/exonuclease/phosphatase (EEP) superfamily protein YafD